MWLEPKSEGKKKYKKEEVTQNLRLGEELEYKDPNWGKMKSLKIS